MAQIDFEKPNIVLFMVDQLSAKWLELASTGVLQTPNIDRLRKDGVTFTRAITSNPVCMPSRATIVTGLTTRGHGVLENGYQLKPEIPNFVQILRKFGWRTGAFGKIHFKPHFAGVYPKYEVYGFDAARITEDFRAGEWIDWVRKRYPEYYEAALATIWSIEIPELRHYGFKSIDLRSKILKIREKWKWASPRFPKNTSHGYVLPFPTEMSQTNWITRCALNFFKNTKPDQPFFTQISYVEPHTPFCAPAEYLKYVDSEKIPPPLIPEWLEDPHAPKYFKYWHDKGRIPVSGDWHYNRHLYLADVVHLDHQLGKILNKLEETGRAENTYFFFLSDHGELLYDHGLCGKEERHYDACVRVPLIIAGPDFQKSTICQEIIQLEDICPTILDMTSQKIGSMPKMGTYLKVKDEEIPVLPGRSLLPFCLGDQPEDWRDAAYCESYNAIWSIRLGDWARTIRTMDFRYTVYADDNGEQMFDLHEDPDEQHNIVANPSYSKVRQELRDRLLNLIVMQDYPKTRRELFALGVH